MPLPTPFGRPDGAAPRLLFIGSEDWAFLTHRLPMARAAQAAGFEIHVATHVGDLGAAIAREGFVLHPVPFARGRLSPMASLRTILALRRVQRAVAPVLVHRVAVQPVVLGGIAALGRPVAAVNALTGLGYTFISGSPKARLLKAVISALLRFVIDRDRSVALVQNPDDHAMLRGLGIPEARIALIPGSGVDVDRLQPMPEPDGPVTIAFVGRLLADKGLRPLVAAHRLLRQRGQRVDLLIAGTPDPANPASIPQAEVDGWGREDGITLLGYVADVATVWRRAHIAVLPSRREGLPKSLLEAAACGRPMVATDVPGCREIAIAGETGLLVPVDDAPALAAAIGELAASPELRARFGAGARRRAVERFSAEAIGGAVVALYMRLAAAGV